MNPAIPYCFTAGFSTLFGHAVIHSEHAVQRLLKSTIDPAPGGHTANVLDSFTVDSFLGEGAFLSCPFAI